MYGKSMYEWRNMLDHRLVLFFVYAKVDIREKTVKTIQNRTTSDPCSTDPCLNDGYSSVDDNFDPGFKCRCPLGFSGDLCKITPCSRDP